MKSMRYLATLVVTASLVLGACSKKQNAESTPPAADNSAQPAQPAPDNGAQSSQPAASAPATQAQQTPNPTYTQSPTTQAATQAAAPVAEAPPPPPPPPKPVVIPAGTTITVRLRQAVGSKTSNQGDRFDASLASPITVQGKTAVPAGATAYGQVTQAHAAGKFKGGATLALTLTNLTVAGSTYAIQTSTSSQSSTGKGKRSAAMIGGGGAGGALIGGLAGGGKGAAIGALVGAGAGTAGATLTGNNRDISVPAESALSFKLTAPVTLKPHADDSQN